jgi:hypothetical protein
VRKAIQIAQFRSHHGHAQRSKFCHGEQAFSFGIMIHQVLDLLLQLLSIALGMFQLITEDPQTARTGRNGQATTHRVFCQSHQLLRRLSSVMTTTLLAQELTQRCWIGLTHGLGAGIGFEDGECGCPGGISEDPMELWKENHQQGMDFIFVAHHVLTQLLVQPHQFSRLLPPAHLGHSQSELLH